MANTRKECRRFLDEWGNRSFEDPRLGRRLADEGLERVYELGDPPDLRARALANQGTSYRAVGDQGRAETLYKEADRLYLFLVLSPDVDSAQRRQAALDRADLDRRWAYLRMEQRRFPEALDKAAAAEIVFLVANDPFNMGLARMTRGVIHMKSGVPEEAIPHLSHALTLIDPEKHANAAYAAAHNLQVALTDTAPDFETLEATLRRVTEGRLSRSSRRPSRIGSMRRQLMGHRRRNSLPDAKARGLQGRILVLLFQHDEARRLLETSREDLVELGALLDAAAVDIELAECYLWFSDAQRWIRVEHLAKEALDLLASVPDIPETLAAFKLWHEAVAARSLNRTHEMIGRCRGELIRGRTGQEKA